MTPPFRLFIRTFFANRTPLENTRFHVSTAGCKRPKWCFSATVAMLVAMVCQAQPEFQVRPTFQGDVKSVSKSELFLTTDSGNGIKFRVNGKTTFYEDDKKINVSAVKVGQHVAVEAKFALDGSYDAINVRLSKPAPPSP